MPILINKFDRYYFKLIIPYFIGATLFFVMLFVLGGLQAILSSLPVQNISFDIILNLLLMTIPQHLWISMPVGLVLGNALTFGHMSANSEILAIKSFGIPLEKLLKPVMIFSIITMILTFIDIEYLDPYYSLNFKKSLFSYTTKSIDSTIVEDQWVSYNGYNINVDEIEEKNGIKYFKNIRILKRDKEDWHIVADNAYIDKSYYKDMQIAFVLQNGELYIDRYGVDKTINTSVFSEMTFFFPNRQVEPGLSLQNYPISKIWKRIRENRKENIMKMNKYYESGDIIHNKLSELTSEEKNIIKYKPLFSYKKVLYLKLGVLISCLIFAFSGFALVKGIKKLNIGIALFISFIIIMLFYGVFQIGTTFIKMYTNLSYFTIYSLVLIFFFLISFSLYYRGRRF